MNKIRHTTSFSENDNPADSSNECNFSKKPVYWRIKVKRFTWSFINFGLKKFTLKFTKGHRFPQLTEFVSILSAGLRLKVFPVSSYTNHLFNKQCQK
jgi:hypothetical protein